ncbi:PepSY domain-containing protein [Alishewanella sp. d11]|uniref:PepSY domain-containing protein n=1 Tax=Alishewanella sp. d11 TaxID=3414030 RepID=UPI003BF776AC
MLRLISVLICSFMLVAAPLQSFADEKKPPAREQNQSKNRVISKEIATQLAQQHYPGKILKVQSEPLQFKVRVMQADGRVVNVVVDGQNGRVKREE